MKYSGRWLWCECLVDENVPDVPRVATSVHAPNSTGAYTACRETTAYGVIRFALLVQHRLEHLVVFRAPLTSRCSLRSHLLTRPLLHCQVPSQFLPSPRHFAVESLLLSQKPLPYDRCWVCAELCSTGKALGLLSLL